VFPQSSNVGRANHRVISSLEMLGRLRLQHGTSSAAHYERVQAVERMQRDWQAERDALATVRRFNAIMSAKGYVWFDQRSEIRSI
jgi:hypothetical protein